jgi:ATP-dependent exoDNAse (exonuclease V) beta subunit
MKVSNVVVQDGNEDPFNRKYYIHIFPNILRENSSRERVPDVIQNKITEHSLYKQLKEKQKRELKRVLYVGMTRAKDYLYTVKYKELTVLKNIGITPSDDNFYGVCAQSPEVLELVDAPEKTVSTYTETIKASKHTQYEKITHHEE